MCNATTSNYPWPQRKNSAKGAAIWMTGTGWVFMHLPPTIREPPPPHRNEARRGATGRSHSAWKGKRHAQREDGREAIRAWRVVCTLRLCCSPQRRHDTDTAGQLHRTNSEPATDPNLATTIIIIAIAPLLHHVTSPLHPHHSRPSRLAGPVH